MRHMIRYGLWETHCAEEKHCTVVTHLHVLQFPFGVASSLSYHVRVAMQHSVLWTINELRWMLDPHWVEPASQRVRERQKLAPTTYYIQHPKSKSVFHAFFLE